MTSDFVLSLYGPHIAAMVHQPKTCDMCEQLSKHMTTIGVKLDPNELSREREAAFVPPEDQEMS